MPEHAFQELSCFVILKLINNIGIIIGDFDRQTSSK